MATLSEFSSVVRDKNLSRPYLFYVTIVPPVGITGNLNVISLMCHTAMTPSTQMYTNDDYVELGIKRRVAYDYDYQNLTLSFFVDGKFETKKFFDTWKSKIVPDRRNFNYPEDYTAEQIILNMVDLQGKVVYKYTYKKAYPKNIQSVDLNFGAMNQASTFTVDFVFETVESSVEESVPTDIPTLAGITSAEILQNYYTT